jgi:Holliday junction resolvase RusA-like endonuclease
MNKNNEFLKEINPSEEEMKTLKNKLLEQKLSEKDLKKALEFIQINEETNKTYMFSVELNGPPKHFKRHRIGKDNHVFSPHGDDLMSLSDRTKMSLPNGFIPFNGPCELFTTIYRQIPNSFTAPKIALAELGYIKPTSTPDYDNYIKLISDSLNGIAYTDDAVVTFGQVDKKFSRRPRTEIVIIGRYNRLYK